MKRKCNSSFYEGRRSNNIKHAQLRMNCSKLNAHLFLLHVSDTTGCTCGYDMEDTEHFLFQCPLYHIQRRKMMQAIITQPNVNVQLLLYGDAGCSFLTNKNIFKAVHEFISDTERL